MSQPNSKNIPYIVRLLKNNRINLGVSQVYIAEKLGVNKSLDGFWETGRTQPTLLHVEKYAEALGAYITLSFDWSELNEETSLR